MIVRGKRPERGFTIIDNAVLRDDRLSFRARGVLASILSRPDGWRTDHKTLAREGLEGQKAIREALKELRAAGYMVQVRRQGERGRWTTETVVYDTPQTSTESENMQVTPSGSAPSFGGPNFGEPPLIETTETNDCDEDEVECLAQSARAHTNINKTEVVPIKSWRAEDRELFADTIAATHLTSDGTAWKEGTWPIAVWYQALRERKDNPQQWPGRYLATIEETDGVDDWLFDRGLERAYLDQARSA